MKRVSDLDCLPSSSFTVSVSHLILFQPSTLYFINWYRVADAEEILIFGNFH